MRLGSGGKTTTAPSCLLLFWMNLLVLLGRREVGRKHCSIIEIVDELFMIYTLVPNGDTSIFPRICVSCYK